MKCYDCGSNQIDGYDPYLEDDFLIIREFVCRKCNFGWEGQYELVRVISWDDEDGEEIVLEGKNEI